MDQKQIVKTGMPLVIIGGMLLLFFWVGRLVGGGGKSAAPEPVEAASAPAAAAGAASEPGAGGGGLATIVSAEAGNQVAERVRAAKGDVDRAIRAMRGATKPNHGGYVEKAQAELDRTASDVAEAIAFAEAHPELSAVPGGVAPEALAMAEHVKGLSLSKPNNQGHLEDGLAGLQSALEALQEARGGNIGGNREKLIGDMDRSATAIFDGFEFLHNGGGKTRSVPKVPEVVPGPQLPPPRPMPAPGI